jgi:hypothetical protein
LINVKIASLIKFLFRHIAFILLLANFSLSQINVFERNYIPLNNYSGVFSINEFRRKIDLCGSWNVSFDDEKTFSKLQIPVSYNFNGEVFFKKNFKVTAELISANSFVLVFEGINYESKISINGNFITDHIGGYNSSAILIEQNVISADNEISITVDNRLNKHSTLPLSNQINFSNNYGGIFRDIYLVAVNKAFVFSTNLNFFQESESNYKITNSVKILSSNLQDTLKGKSFFLRTKMYSANSEDAVSTSDKVKIKIENFSTQISENKLSIKNPSLWSPESPFVYTVVAELLDDDDNILDKYTQQYGLSNTQIKGNEFYLNGEKFFIKGINFREESEKFGESYDFAGIRKDLENIKSTGFNCIRIPGRPASPFTLSVCDSIGLFVLQEIPFNEVCSNVLRDNEYTQSALDYLESIVIRDNNHPAILFWGVGNNFALSASESSEYLNKCVTIIRKYDSRKTYFTTSAQSDSIGKETDIVGFNIKTRNEKDIKNFYLKAKTLPGVKFISSLGVSINNLNKNGYSDFYSVDFQTKYLIDNYKLLKNDFIGIFISSYSDWTTSRPLINAQDANQYLVTDGIFTFQREPKLCVNFLKHILNNQDIPKLMEGTNSSDQSYIFIIFGVFVLIVLFYSFNKSRKFKEYFSRFTLRRKYFYEFIKDQSSIPGAYNLILSFAVNSGIAIFFGSFLYYFRENNSFDVIFSNIVTSNYIKLFLSEFINTPYKILITIFFILVFSQIIIAFLISVFSYFIRGRSFFKIIYTIIIWSSIPFLILLPIGMIFYKLSVYNNSFISLFVYLYIILFIFIYFRIAATLRIPFEMKSLKTFIISILILFSFCLSIYFYLLDSRIISLFSLIKSYNL